jgi:hypothetical protein
MAVQIDICDRCHMNIRPEAALMTMTGRFCGDCARKRFRGIAHAMSDEKQRFLVGLATARA